MILDEIVLALKAYKVALENSDGVRYFDYEVLTAQELFVECFRKEVPLKGYSKKSGVYIITDEELNILYIGKATADNLGAEVYSKFGTSTTPDGNFANSLLAKNTNNSKHKQLLIGGRCLFTP